MRRNGRVGLITIAVLCLTLGAGGALADDSADVIVINTAPQERGFSNRELQDLQPVVNDLMAPDTSAVVADVWATPHSAGAMTKDGIVAESRAFGSFAIPYTTTRVQDGGQSARRFSKASRQSTTYPYRTVGKLTFDQGYCSASLIRKSVIVTAAHCIQSFGSGANIYSKFVFTPGHWGPTGATEAQLAPHGRWWWKGLVRPATWADGTDIGSGSARDNDIAVIVLTKKSGKFIGDTVGYLGYGWNNYSFVTSSKTGNLHTAAVSTLGYPGKIDGGKKMQRTDGPTYTTTVSDAGQLWQGSNFTGGSSGGPWVVNFRTRNAFLSGGAVPGDASVMAVIGVTSWGAGDPNAPKDNYSSQFRQNTRYPDPDYGGYGAGNIASLLNTLCNSTAPEGGTFKSQGYCS